MTFTMSINPIELSRARESRAAIEKLYIEMRHLFNRGSYKPLGKPGEVITDALLTLRPEIYGSMGDPSKVELEGLVYVVDRLPRGIEECRLIKLISEEGYGQSNFEVIIPVSRRRNCYRIDEDQMFIQVTRGRSEIYDILTHLTFLYIEAGKISAHAIRENGKPSHEWLQLKQIVTGEVPLNEHNEEIALTYLSTILGRTFEETRNAYQRMARRPGANNGLFHVVYWLGKLSMDEKKGKYQREISFSPTLRQRLGHHIYGERWAQHIKTYLAENDLLDRPIHIISANLHSVMNSLYAYPALERNLGDQLTIDELAMKLNEAGGTGLQERVMQYAESHGMVSLDDATGTSIQVQIFDTAQLVPLRLAPEIRMDRDYIAQEKPVIIVMDYAFGEQAYETMDELLKPYRLKGKFYRLPVVSISIMGKAGILEGGKGDIMIPTAHIFEGTADNYPLDNDFNRSNFEAQGFPVYEGPMITVLGTSLQNRDVLSYFKNSSWEAIGLEMEGAHYQKAIQAAVRIRRSVNGNPTVRYAYYASDNPLITGSTLASGSLGLIGVRPTYLITRNILNRVLSGVSNQVIAEKNTG
jgi:hypothetical protein